MSKERVINHNLHPEMLESGQVLAAAGTPGSAREDVLLSEADRRRLAGRVTVVVVEEAAEAAAEEAAEAPVVKARKSE